MIALLSFTTLAVATILALAAGTVLQWLLLRISVRMMQPATSQWRVVVRTELVHGTAQLTRSFASHR